MKSIKGYKFLTSKNKSSNGNTLWKKGVWQKHKGKLELCKRGFHASRTPLQSLDYVYGDNWWIVEARGKFLEQKDDKFTCSEMRIVKQLPVKKILVRFAIACAKRCLKNFEKEYPKDKRPRQAIEAAERYINNPTEKNKEAARSAWSAAGSAAGSAGSAAWAAVWSAGSAGSAAWSAEKQWQEKKLINLVRQYSK